MLTESNEDVATLRAFNRVYTSRLEFLDATLDNSPFTLSEARVLYELAHRSAPRAAEIARALRIDRAQISRTLKRFARRGLLETQIDRSDGRHQLLSLTRVGKAAFDDLDRNTREAISALLGGLPYYRRTRLLSSARTITRLFQQEAPLQPLLRGLRAGDLGLVTARQAIVYAEEYGWNGDYEALVARILADFHKSFNPECEAAWIADLDDRMVGSIFLVRGDNPAVGKLRLLYVEPDARGAGVG